MLPSCSTPPHITPVKSLTRTPQSFANERQNEAKSCLLSRALARATHTQATMLPFSKAHAHVRQTP